MAAEPLTPELRRRVKLRLLQMHFDAGVGHIGGNLSALDVLLALYHGVLQPADAFVLSKGHAAGAWYAALWSAGRLREQDLRTFHQEGTRLSGHPPAAGIPQIAFATGSLGHGFGLANGLALAKRLRGEAGHVYGLTSDGEWNEGSTWESLIFAKHHRLGNVTIIVDLNGLQAFGSTKEVADLEPMAEKFRSFGVNVIEVDGHDLSALAAALPPTDEGGATAGTPRVVIARTCKGCGISFMVDRMEWHYLPMTAEQYQQAVREVQAEVQG